MAAVAREVEKSLINNRWKEQTDKARGEVAWSRVVRQQTR